MAFLNETHDPARRSWVESANAPDCDFPIQNLPFGVFRVSGERPARVGIAIGDGILDVSAIVSQLPHEAQQAALLCAAPALNDLMRSGAAGTLRRAVSELLSTGHRRGRERVAQHLFAMGDVEMMLPAEIGNYTDFYASVYHATNVGRLFRPNNPLLPNYKWLPIAYHGRASSVIVSGHEVVRPKGQTKPAIEGPPLFGPCRNLDYEVELGVFIGEGSELGKPISIEQAGGRIFGFCILNDWSARDVQPWESQPLGPFLAKNFATSLSPWVVTREALEPFRTGAFPRGKDDPRPLPYLESDEDQTRGGFDITLEAYLLTEKMRAAFLPPHRLSRASATNLYWTVAQMIAHHTSNGCNLQTGDLIGTGTVSGKEKSSWGSLLELTKRGTEPLRLPNGETRAFLEDGDELIMTGECRREGFARIGFGECRARVLANSE
jgi:fumarylacetoacetase